MGRPSPGVLDKPRAKTILGWHLALCQIYWEWNILSFPDSLKARRNYIRLASYLLALLGSTDDHNKSYFDIAKPRLNRHDITSYFNQ